MKALTKMIGDFRSLHPAFYAALVALEEEWRPDDPPITIVMSQLAGTLADRIAEFSTADRVKVFDLVEKTLASADPVAKDAVATGFLESLQSRASAAKFSFSELAPFLGCRTRDFCRAWDEFTGVSTPGLL